MAAFSANSFVWSATCSTNATMLLTDSSEWRKAPNDRPSSSASPASRFMSVASSSIFALPLAAHSAVYRIFPAVARNEWFTSRLLSASACSVSAICHFIQVGFHQRLDGLEQAQFVLHQPDHAHLIQFPVGAVQLDGHLLAFRKLQPVHPILPAI